MPDTGAPWNIPYVAGTDLVADWPTDNQTQAEAIATALDSAAGFDTLVVITASDPSWPVPTLASPVVRVTCIGGGGGGGGGSVNGGASFVYGGDGGAGGTTTFDIGGGTTVTAAGGNGGRGGGQTTPSAATVGNAAGNSGQGGNLFNVGNNTSRSGEDGRGGAITINYLDLTSIANVAVTVGAGGSAGAAQGSGAGPGSAGGRGEVYVEYRAG